MEHKSNYTRQEAIAFVGNHLPRQCGIATFTTDLANAVSRHVRDRFRTFVVAMNDRPEGYDYSNQVRFQIDKEDLGDYIKAAEYLNSNRVNVVCLQHEFGIFGGDDGRNLLLMLRDMRPPLVTTLHTILENPTKGQRKVFEEIIERSSRLIVMSRKGEAFLKSVYGVPDDKIAFIHHGVPEIEFGSGEHYKANMGLRGRRMILTFGLLSPNKGIEYMIKALPPLVEKHPDVVFVLLGATHPHVKKTSGDEYRHSLQRLARSLGVEKHVIFQDRFVNLSELCDFLAAADIYVTPYLNREQITSGTLAYALGAGCGIVSTPYWYAEELLAEGRGTIVPFRDSGALTDAVMLWLDDMGELERVRSNAYDYTRQMLWKSVARQYVEIFEKVAIHEPVTAKPRVLKRLATASKIPRPKLDHIVRLTDDTGIIQHAKFNVPDPLHGYSVDDAARGVLVMTKYNWLYDSELAVRLLSRYLTFMRYSQIDDGMFHNFVAYDRSFVDVIGSADTLGRSLWGLGYAVAYAPDGYWQMAKEMFDLAVKNLSTQSVRGSAYAVLGLYFYTRKYPDAKIMTEWMKKLAEGLAAQYRSVASEGWSWFEEEISYDNALPSHAMFRAYSALGVREYLAIAKESLDFLIGICRQDKAYSLIGSKGWYVRGGKRAQFDQQPIDACSLVEATWTASRTTGEVAYLEEMMLAYEWFFGSNDMEMPVYDFHSGGCADGLTAEGTNKNRGAESTICYLLATLDMIEMSSDNTKGLDTRRISKETPDDAELSAI